MRFTTIVQQTGKNTTGIPVPGEVVEALGSGRRPQVKVTVGGHTYRSSIASMRGTFMISLSSDNRAEAGVGAGDEVEVEIELDTEPREVIVPADLAEALAGDPAAKSAFDRLSYSKQRWHALAIEGAKTSETRQRRVEKSLGMLRESP